MKLPLYIGAIISFVLLSFLSHISPYFSFDVMVSHTLQQISFPLFKSYMEILTWSGNMIPGLIIFILICAGLLTSKHNKEAVILIIARVGTGLAGDIMKFIVNRPRPPADLIMHWDKTNLSTPSFPSSHVVLYTVTLGLLLYFSKKIKLPSYFSYIFVIILVSIGLSRIYLGAHWFSDVLGGYLLGYIGIQTVLFFEKRIKIG